ncbi:MAG TPA: YdeI/OmpD-associated family protein [Dehalococcoidales bacterium]|nr:YdeI/OmpD-associated family protein [Dehalococcoidales bacterium]
MEIQNALYFPTRREWRKWLEKNHAKETEAWVLRYKKDSGKSSVTYEEALEEALCYGWIDGRMRGVDSEKSAVRFSPRKAKSRWSKVNKDKAEKMIAQGKMTAAGMTKIEDARESGAWASAYVLKEAQEIPADLQKALQQNKEIWSNFQKFPPSRRNGYIYWLDDAKTPATRQKRIAEIIDRSAVLKQPKPKPGEKWWQVRR